MMLLLVIFSFLHSSHCHMVSFPGHLTTVPLGLQSLPVLHVAKVAPTVALTPTVLASSSSAIRQIHHNFYTPYQYAPAYPPNFLEGFEPYPVLPPLPPYGNPGHHTPQGLFNPIHLQQVVPPNVSVSKLPPLLEGFVQRIQNLLSNYNYENHRQEYGPTVTSVGVNPPLTPMAGGTPQNLVPPTFSPAPVLPSSTSPPMVPQLRPQPVSFLTTTPSPLPSENNVNQVQIQPTEESAPETSTHAPSLGSLPSNQNNNNVQKPQPTPERPVQYPSSIGHLPNQPQGSVNRPNNQNNRPVPSVGNKIPSNSGSSGPSISQYGPPDPISSFPNNNRPSNAGSSNHLPRPSYNEHGRAEDLDPSRIPQRNPNKNQGGIQLLGNNKGANSLIALLQQYGVPVSQGQEGQDKSKGGSGGSFSIVPITSLAAPNREGERYNYNEPARPLRYPSRTF